MSFDRYRPPKKDNLDFVIFVGVFAVLALLIGAPFLGLR
jgi:hypothetical protein